MVVTDLTVVYVVVRISARAFHTVSLSVFRFLLRRIYWILSSSDVMSNILPQFAFCIWRSRLTYVQGTYSWLSAPTTPALIVYESVKYGYFTSQFRKLMWWHLMRQILRTDSLDWRLDGFISPLNIAKFVSMRSCMFSSLSWDWRKSSISEQLSRKYRPVFKRFALPEIAQLRMSCNYSWCIHANLT